MSNWIEINKQDIELSDDKEEIEIMLEPDEFGNNYITVKVKDIKELLGEKLFDK